MRRPIMASTPPPASDRRVMPAPAGRRSRPHRSRSAALALGQRVVDAAALVGFGSPAHADAAFILAHAHDDAAALANAADHLAILEIVDLGAEWQRSAIPLFAIDQYRPGPAGGIDSSTPRRRAVPRYAYCSAALRHRPCRRNPVPRCCFDTASDRAPIAPPIDAAVAVAGGPRVLGVRRMQQADGVAQDRRQRDPPACASTLPEARRLVCR